MIDVTESYLEIRLTGDDAMKFKDLIRNAEVDQLGFRDKEFAECLRETLSIPPHYSKEYNDW